ncbi:MAG: hypothetical protein MI923_20655 [Phycisphaerales bacterium]|nr:hypothetical protein [Phycisphaerales bacterium]
MKQIVATLILLFALAGTNGCTVLKKPIKHTCHASNYCSHCGHPLRRACCDSVIQTMSGPWLCQTYRGCMQACRPLSCPLENKKVPGPPFPVPYGTRYETDAN